MSIFITVLGAHAAGRTWIAGPAPRGPFIAEGQRSMRAVPRSRCRRNSSATTTQHGRRQRKHSHQEKMREFWESVKGARPYPTNGQT